MHPHCSTPGPAVFLKFCPCSNAPVGFVQARRRPRAGYNFSLNTFSPGVASTHSTSQRDTSHYSFLLAWTWLFDYHSLIDIDNPDTHFETTKHKYHLPVPYPFIKPRLFKSTTFPRDGNDFHSTRILLHNLTSNEVTGVNHCC